MNPCTKSPNGKHAWRDAAPETADGSTLLTCAHAGCTEIAYRLRTPTVPRRRGVPIR